MSYTLERGAHVITCSFITDADGEAYEFINYLPFGELMAEQSTASFGTPYKFNGKELDEETGLYDYGARYYDPSLSLWMSVDPLADAPLNVGTSPYAYVWNNPLKFIDPDGRHGQSVENEYVKDKTTGEVTKISDVGGDEVDIVYDGTVNDDGSVTVDAKTSKVMDVTEKHDEDYTDHSQDEKPTPGVRNLDANYTSYHEWAEGNPLSDPAGLKAGLQAFGVGGGSTLAGSKGKVKPTAQVAAISFFVTSYITTVRNGEAYRSTLTPAEKKAKADSHKRAVQMLKTKYGDEEGRH